MRIALFVETYLPHINGVVTHVKILKDGLESLGHSVLIVTADPSAKKHYISDGVMHCPAITAKKLYGFGVSNPISNKRLRLLSQFNPDIIHTHQEFGTGLFAVGAAKILHKPLVYTMHTMYDEYMYYVAPQALIPLIKRISHVYSRFLAGAAHGITGPSKKVEEYFRQIGLKKQLNVIPNSVDIEKFAPSSVSDEQKLKLRTSLNIPADVKVAIFVGRLGREKSVDVALDYWAKCVTADDKLHFLIVGDGPSRGELEEQARRLGIGHMVTFAGKIPNDELPPYYAICDLYLTASLSDTCSISMLEGMAGGLPVLQIYDELNREQIIDGNNGFMFGSAEEMAELMRQIRDKTPEEIASLRSTVLESVRKSSSIALANSLLSVYKAAIIDMKRRSLRQKISLQRHRLSVRVKQIRRRMKRRFRK